MTMLSTIVYGSDIILFLILVGIPLSFIKLFPSMWRNWSKSSLIRRCAAFAHGVFAGICCVAVVVIALRISSVAAQEGRLRVENNVGVQLSRVSSYLSRYHIEYGEIPQGDAVEIWQTILKDDRIRYDWEKAEDENMKTNKNGALVDRWGNPI